jgi:hypothetical protein
MYWSDISTTFVNSEMKLFIGHHKGIITSQLLDLENKKSNTMERKF